MLACRLVLLVGIALAPLSGLSAMEAIKKSEYDQIRKARAAAPTFVSRKIEDGMAAYLKKVREDWTVETQVCPDPTFAKIAALTWVKESVEGVVSLYTHKTPKFSFLNQSRNVREAVIAATTTVALPISLDSLIHTREGLAFVRLSKSRVEVFEDTEKGLRRTVYVDAPKE